MDILPIQGSAVPCERVFLSGKETTTARRNRMGSNLMEELQMLKFAFRKGSELDFTAGTGRDDEIRDLEADLEQSLRIPNDIDAFIQSLLNEFV
ncbi:hypothetical protein H0H93_016068 [Arthromyces matolae]|nr:hypothetical protein H0H93_016068 [Arthromyces matolae]